MARDKRAERCELTADWVVEELRKLAGANMADYMKSTPEGLSCEMRLTALANPTVSSGRPQGAPVTDRCRFLEIATGR